MRVKIAEINTMFSETIRGIKIIQLFEHEKNNYKRFEKINNEKYMAGIDQVHIFALFMPVIELLSSIGLAIVIFYGGSQVLSDSISLGTLVVFISYMRMFFRPIRDIAEKYNIMQNAMASAERIFTILNNKDDKAVSEISRNGNFEKPDEVFSISLKSVYFSYDNEEDVLKNISFDINKGQTIAVVGPTGSGKTSLINLLVRFHEPTKGGVLINGKDIKDFNINSVRSKIGIVMQDPFLFSGTIRENIENGKSGLSNEEINQILKISNCSSFVDKLKKGVDTILTEEGDSISSGERQLISIARAFALDPDFIILDEATSYIDTETEIKIQDALSKLMKKRTTIIIAHRLSTARKADNIIVLKSGEIIESGTHDVLMENKSFYYNLNMLE